MDQDVCVEYEGLPQEATSGMVFVLSEYHEQRYSDITCLKQLQPLFNQYFTSQKGGKDKPYPRKEILRVVRIRLLEVHATHDVHGEIEDIVKNAENIAENGVKNCNTCH
jgi:hypothetical protein